MKKTFFFKKSLFFVTFALVLLSRAHGFVEVEIRQISRSKKSLSLGYGGLDGLKTGQRGWFLSRDAKTKIKMKKVAFGEAIKVFPTTSYWFLSEIPLSYLLVEGQRLLLLEMSSLKGRSPIDIRKKRVILDKLKTPEQYLEEQENGEIPREIIQRGEDYSETRELVETSPLKEQEIEVTTFSKWEKEKGRSLSETGGPEENIYSIPEDQGPSFKEVRSQRKKDLLDSLAEGAVDKGYFYKDLDDLYENIEATSFVQERSLKPSVYEEYQRKKKEENFINPFAVEKILGEGDLWSSDFDRDQLRDFFVSSGIALERERQKFALENEVGHEFFILYGVELNSHIDSSDKNYQGSGVSLGIGYDYFLMKTTKKLEHFSLEFFLETANNYYDFGTKNALAKEISFKLSLNWYLMTPSSLRKYIWYLGTGIQIGGATLKNVSFSSSYNVQIREFPTIHLGLKYRFGGRRKGDWADKSIGLHFLLSSGMRSLTVSDQIKDDIKVSLSVGGLRFSGGLSFLF